MEAVTAVEVEEEVGSEVEAPATGEGTGQSGFRVGTRGPGGGARVRV